VTRTSDPEGASESDVTVSDRSICFVFYWPHSTIKKKKEKPSGVDLVKSKSIISFPIVLVT